MDDLNKFRKLAGLLLIESHFDPETDAIIDKAIVNFAPEEKKVAYDALDILHDAGDNGLTGPEWKNRIAAIHPNLPQGIMAKIANALKGIRIGRGGHGFVWEIGTAQPEQATTPDEDDAQFKMQAGFTKAAGIIMNTARRADYVTIGGLARNLSREMGMPLDIAAALVGQTISNNPQMFTKVDDQNYKFNDPIKRTPDAMTTFRSIASTGKLPGDE